MLLLRQACKVSRQDTFTNGTLHFVGGLQYICERTTGNVILLQENANALKQDYAIKAVNGP